MIRKKYIGDPVGLNIKLKDSNGAIVPNLTVFDDIVLWVEDKRGNKVYAEWSVSAGTATISTDTVSIIINKTDLQNANLETVRLMVRPMIADAAYDGGYKYSTTAYNLFELLKNAKSHERV
jgi:hypothetical protein